MFRQSIRCSTHTLDYKFLPIAMIVPKSNHCKQENIHQKSTIRNRLSVNTNLMQQKKIFSMNEKDTKVTDNYREGVMQTKQYIK